MKIRKVTELMDNCLKENKTYYTLEYFPPKTIDGLNNLHSRIERMSSNLRPTCVHLTWNPSSSDTSLELIDLIQNQFMIPCCLHLTCTNIQTSKLHQTLSRAKEIGIVNILALRGDPPRGTEPWIATDQNFKHAIDLVRYIRNNFGDHFCIGVAGYPEGDGNNPNRPNDDGDDDDRELKFLREKVEAGAEFIVTQLFYDVENFMGWFERCRRIGIKVPILPGIMPIQTYQGFRRLTSLCKTKIPSKLSKDLNSIKNDDQSVREYGIKLSTEIIKRLQSDLGIRCFHLSTLNLERSITRIIESLGWNSEEQEETRRILKTPNQDPFAHLRTPEILVNHLPSTQDLIQLGKQSTWDEFPNGRFGDPRSPAFDLEKGYNSPQPISNRNPPSDDPSGSGSINPWGSPTTKEEITEMFCSFTRGEIPLTPWSEEPLALETSPIKSYLLTLNQAGLWTVGSQPAVDGVDSTDQVFGFGPPGGMIYQKAFVEFFIDEDLVEGLIESIEGWKDPDGINQFRYFAGNFETESGEIRSNVREGESNSVTWGVFKNAEVLTTTLIEESSFKTWKEEAFEIWNRWESLTENGSESKEFLRGIVKRTWLVSLVNHDYKDGFGLWKFLMEFIDRSFKK